MKKMMLLFLLGGVMLSAVGVEWQKDYEAAAKMAAEQKKPMMLLFTAPSWCGYCVRLEKNVFKQAKFKKVMNKTIPVVFDFSDRNKVTPEMQKMAAKFKVRGFPTMVITDAEGNVKGQKAGFGGKADAYIKDLNRMIGK